MDSRENGNDSSEFISIVLTEMATAISWTVKSKLLAAQEELMFQALQRKVKVGAGGKIEFMAPECPEGIDVQVIVLVSTRLLWPDWRT